MSDLTITGTAVTGSSSTVYTRSKLRQWFRFYLDNLGTSNIPDSSDTVIDTNDLLLMAYEEYARQTKCFDVSYTITATPDTAIYDFTLFGSGAGERIFALSYVGYDSEELDHQSLTDLNNTEPNWREQDSGKPRIWTPWGDSSIRFHPAPDSALPITIEGWELPNPSTFDSDDDYPHILKSDQQLIAMYAAILATVKNPNDENAIRQSVLFPQWNEGTKKAVRRIHGTGDTVEFGKYTDKRAASRFNISNTITNIT